jgi:hypothetical protein
MFDRANQLGTSDRLLSIGAFVLMGLVEHKVLERLTQLALDD